MPLKKCIVKFCDITSSIKTEPISFHLFPLSPELKEKWIEACCRDDYPAQWTPSRTATVCSKHFKEDCFIQINKRTQLKEDSVPTERLPEKIPWNMSLRDRAIDEYRVARNVKSCVRPWCFPEPKKPEPVSKVRCTLEHGGANMDTDQMTTRRKCREELNNVEKK